MPRARKRTTPKSIKQVNRECKFCILRYSIVIGLGLSIMAYCLKYDQPNVPFRHKLLDESNLIIMSFNVRGSNLDSKNTTKWQSRRQVALEMINLYNPDIIGLQEPQRNQLETFKQNGYNSYGKFIPTSILYNKTKYNMIDGNTLWLSKTPNIQHSTSWDASQERTLTWILVIESDDNNNCNGDTQQQCNLNDIDKINKGYLIFNTHLDHIGENSRMESCLVIKDIIHEISSIKYKNKFPVFLTGDFNAAKYSNVWQCFTENEDDSFELSDALHDAQRFGPWTKLQLQYTMHYFHGLQMNTWYMRSVQYLFFGFSNSIIKLFRNIGFGGVCCMGPSLYRQIYRRKKYDRQAGIHHIDWILYNVDNKQIDKVKYFEVISYHQLIDEDKLPKTDWSLKYIIHDRIVSKTIFPSDHFPIIAGFTIK